MRHSIEVNKNHAMVYLADKIYFQDASVLRDQLLEIIDRGVINLKIDLSELTYIDSSGIGTLVKINKYTKQKEGKLILTNAQGLPRELFTRTRLDKVITII